MGLGLQGSRYLLGLGMGGEVGEGAGDLVVGGRVPTPGQVKAGLQGYRWAVAFPFLHPRQNRLGPSRVEALPKKKAQGDGQIDTQFVEAFVISGTHQARGLGPGAAREGYRGDPLCNWAGRPD